MSVCGVQDKLEVLPDETADCDILSSQTTPQRRTTVLLRDSDDVKINTHHALTEKRARVVYGVQDKVEAIPNETADHASAD